MKIGDLIHRKDMPHIIYRIIGRSGDWHAWKIEIVTNPKGLHKAGLVDMDDERWEVVSIQKKESP